MITANVFWRATILLAALLFLPLSASAQVSAPKSAAEVQDWRWYTDPDFGTDGAVRWVVEVENTSSRTIYQAEVQLTTHDESGDVVSTDFGIVNTIPPGDSASTEEYADYYGTEEKARVRIERVYFQE